MMIKYNFENSIGRLSQEVSKSIGIALESGFRESKLPLEAREWTVLTYLSNNENLCQNDLVIPLGRDKVAVKRLIDKMERKNLLKRKERANDKRFNTIVLTKQGRDMFEKAKVSAEKSLGIIYENISVEKLDECTTILKAILANTRN